MNGDAVGTFEVTSGKIVISDPCYEREIIAAELPAKNGKWEAETYFNSDDRVSHLIVHHENYPINNEHEGDVAPFDVGVDSGQAGVFDSDFYRNDEAVAHLTDEDRHYKEDKIREDEPWYSWCCDRTLGADCAGIVPHGAVSSSGYGDGCYECRLVKDTYTPDYPVVGVIIEFISEEDHEYELDLTYSTDML